jgi:beta-glucanase (GH16 family)
MMRSIGGVLAPLFFLVACGGGGAPDSVSPPPDTKANRTLVWSDEFDGNGLPDSSKWSFDTERNRAGWYNNELQYYSANRTENASVQNGLLTITARRESLLSQSDWGGQAYTSARLITRANASWTYGFMEVRAKLPCSLGTWPAIWLLGTGGTWPDDGEIDIMEQKGTSAGEKGRVSGTIHTRAYNYMNGSLGVGQGFSTAVTDACTAFHNYQLTWTADKISIGVDDQVYFTYEKPANATYQTWPFDRPQFMILNVAMGGDLGGTVPANFTSDAMVVDYVRVYQ